MNKAFDWHGLWAMEEKALKRLMESKDSPSVAAAPSTTNPDNPPPQRPYRVVNGVAVIPLVGPVSKYEDIWQLLMGGVSTLRIKNNLTAALADASVDSILLYVDSPGGTVAGTADLADAIAAAGKPVWAYIADLGASAAYWIASQADRVIANSSAFVGSIGVYQVVYDTSVAFAEMGVKVKLVKAGEYKGVAVPGTEVTDSQLADFQREVTEVYDLFMGAVARGRGLLMQNVKTLADGRVHIAEQAKSLGLIDAVQSFEQTIQELGETMDKTSEEAAAKTEAKVEATVQPKAEAKAEQIVEQPKAEQPKVEQVDVAAVKATAYEQGRADEQARLKAVLGVCGNDAAFAVEQFLAGKDFASAKTAFAEHELSRLKAENQKLADKLKTATTGNPLVSVEAADSRAAVQPDSDEALKVEFEKVKDRFMSYEAFAAYRKWELAKNR